MKGTKTFKTFGSLLAGIWNAGGVNWNWDANWIVTYWKNFTESGSRGIKSPEWVSDEKMKEHLKPMLWLARQWSEKNQRHGARKINPCFIHELKRVYGSPGMLPADCVRVRFLHVSGESHWAKLAAVKSKPSQERSGLVPD